MNRNLDAHIAKLLGLDVLGEARCWRDPETGNWEVSWYEVDPANTMHLVYLAQCDCDRKESEDVVRFNHITSCLEVVPFYHQSKDLAVQTLEHICDERLLVAEPHRVPGGEWVVELTTAAGNEEPVAYGRDGGLALAICKALAQLEEKE